MEEMPKGEEPKIESTEDIGQNWPDIEVIRNLRERNYIKEGSPYWWSTDYAPDPRESLPFEEFKDRLVHLGKCKITNRFLGSPNVYEKDVYLYPEPNVPMTTINLDIEGQELPFFVTARPYNPKELEHGLSPRFLAEHPLETLPEFCRSGGTIDLPNHFYPHIRGLFAGQRGSQFFWYLLRPGFPVNEEDFYHQISESKKRSELSFIDIYTSGYGGEDKTYTEVWNELLEKSNLVDNKKLGQPNFPFLEVPLEEFIQDWQKPEQDLLVYYPLRLSDIKSTLPLVVATRTNKESKTRKPVVLGIYAEDGKHGGGHKAGILRIKDYQMAESISRAITDDFGIDVDTVLFTPQAGRPKYDRISGK
jgi:hypothetical protein